MNEASKNAIISAITSIIGVLGLVPVVAKVLPPDLTTQVPGIVGAISTLIGAAALIYKMFPKSSVSIIKGASELPEVSKIVTTPEIANGPLKDNSTVVAK